MDFHGFDEVAAASSPLPADLTPPEPEAAAQEDEERVGTPPTILTARAKRAPARGSPRRARKEQRGPDFPYKTFAAAVAHAIDDKNREDADFQKVSEAQRALEDLNDGTGYVVALTWTQYKALRHTLSVWGMPEPTIDRLRQQVTRYNKKGRITAAAETVDDPLSGGTLRGPPLWKKSSRNKRRKKLTALSSITSPSSRSPGKTPTSSKHPARPTAPLRPPPR